jgi:hypothetical protein
MPSKFDWASEVGLWPRERFRKHGVNYEPAGSLNTFYLKKNINIQGDVGK